MKHALAPLKRARWMLLAATLWWVAGSALAQGTPLTTVNIGVDSFVLGAQAWVAQDKGFFEANGIKANLRTFSLGVDTVDAVLTGQLDIGFGLDFATLTRLPSKQLRIIAESINPDPGFHKLAVSEGITGPADLAGKRMGYAQGTSEHYVTLRYLQLNDVPQDSVELVALQSVFDIVAALRAHRIDAAWVWGDGVPQAQEIPGVSIIADDSAAKMQPVGYIVTSPAFADQHTDTAAAVLKALAEATDWMDANMEEASQIVADNVRAPQPNVLSVMKVEHYVIQLSGSSLEALGRLGQFMVDQNILKEALDPLDYVDDAPLKQALPDRVQD
jgi:NitT/TauT family transport system substrate-binding protein